MDCPSAETLAAWRGSTLGGPEESTISTHVEGCARCLSTLTPRAEAAGELAAGTHLGRFVVVRRLGAGAMGVVYAALDPQLGRQVAVKLVRGGASAVARARLLREAQAMARLAHPNVVVVYEAAEIDEQVFVVMELVDGTSLDQWLQTTKPDWRGTLELFLQAGRGLAAAHARGIVHRDFKPSNVLVGADGRARVGDFGLAREADEASGPGDAGSPSLASGDLTQTGTVLGTPAYMAPEQRRGERAGAAADLYSFCLALHEALYRTRAVAAAPPAGPVPRALHRVIARGVAARAEDRPASMDALLAELAAAAHPRRRLASALAGVAAVALVGAGMMARGVAVPKAKPCVDAPARLYGIWDAPRKAELRAAFAASGLGDAEARWARVEGAVDRYAASWVSKATEVCAATEVRHAQAPAERALRQACLDQRLEKLRAWVGVMGGASPGLVRRAVESAAQLESLRACDEAVPVVDPRPEDAVLAAEVQSLRNQLEAVDIRARLGEIKVAREVVPRVQQAARAFGYAPLEAEVLERVAMLHMNGGDFDGATVILEEMRRVADAARYDRLRALAWIHLARAYAWTDRPAEAHRAARDADAVIAPIGGRIGEALRLQLASVEADAFWREHELPKALALATQVVDGATRLYGAEDLRLVPRLQQQAVLLGELGRRDEATQVLDRGLRMLAVAGVDEDSALAPAMVAAKGDLAAAAGDAGGALRLYEQAQLALERNLGPAHPSTAKNAINVARTLVALGRPKEALARIAPAREVYEAKLPPEHPERGELYAVMGEAALAAGEGDARKWLEQAVAIKAKAGDGPARLAEVRFALARALWPAGAKERPRARKLAEEARAGLAAEKARGLDIDGWLATHR